MSRDAFVPALALLALLLAAAARAEWPYLTEEASTLKEGHYSVSLGVSRAIRRTVPPPEADGTLWTLPEVDGTLGVGPRAEVSFHYEGLRLDRPGERGFEQSGDLRLWTKLVLLPSEVQDLSLRFGVKLPDASRDRGLGTNQTDFFAALLWDLRLGPVTTSLNLGLGILDDYRKVNAQDDVVTWGAAARWRLLPDFSLGFEGTGLTGPQGRPQKRDLVTVGPVLTWRRGPFRFDAAGRLEVADATGWGWVTGISYER